MQTPLDPENIQQPVHMILAVEMFLLSAIQQTDTYFLTNIQTLSQPCHIEANIAQLTSFWKDIGRLDSEASHNATILQSKCIPSCNFSLS